MARTPTQTSEILAQDMQRLLRILRRAQDNTSRPRKDNEDLIRCLNRSIEILSKTERAVPAASLPGRRAATG
jgi:hypothetical protein